MSKRELPNYTIHFDDYFELVDKLVLESLQNQYSIFKEGLGDMPFVSHDPVEETKYRNKMLKALKRVIKYYGGSVNND